MIVSLRRHLRQAQDQPVIKVNLVQRWLHRDALIVQQPGHHLLALRRPCLKTEQVTKPVKPDAARAARADLNRPPDGTYHLSRIFLLRHDRPPIAHCRTAPSVTLDAPELDITIISIGGTFPGLRPGTFVTPLPGEGVLPAVLSDRANNRDTADHGPSFPGRSARDSGHVPAAGC